MPLFSRTEASPHHPKEKTETGRKDFEDQVMNVVVQMQLQMEESQARRERFMTQVTEQIQRFARSRSASSSRGVDAPNVPNGAAGLANY